MTDATHLYRLWDHRGVLLYIGITRNLYQRLGWHQANQVWWPDVASHTIEELPAGRDPLDVEREVIVSERPRYNVKHQPNNPYARFGGNAVRLPDWINPDLLWDWVRRPEVCVTAWYEDDMKTVRYDVPYHP